MSRIIGLLLVLLVLVAGIAFHLRNSGVVALDYYAGSASLPFSLWLLLALSAGVLLGLLACLPSLIRARVRAARLQRRLQGLAKPASAPPGGTGGAG